MKQTAVEWLIEQLIPSIALQQKYIDEIFKQAKEMERQQIITAVNTFALGSSEVVNIVLKKYGLDNSGESYYKKTYGE